MAFSFKGYGENVLTFKDEVTKVGIPVAVHENCIVRPAEQSKDFIGITCYADGEVAGVIVDGYVEMHYTGNDPNYGYCNLVANSSGGVTLPVSSGKTDHFVRVLKIDPETKTVGFIL